MWEDNEKSLKIHHCDAGAPITGETISSQKAGDDEATEIISVQLQDFVEACNNLRPSISDEELARYAQLQRDFTL